MVDSTKLYSVKNRSARRVIYRVPEENIRREFAPGETKRVTFGELQQLTFQPGGRQLIIEYLQIQDDEVLNNVGINPQPEYHMSEQQIIELLTKGTYEAFLDCLDFAPTGIIDLIKKYAVSLPLADYQKKEALRMKTGFDVDSALKANREIAEDTKALERESFAKSSDTNEKAETIPTEPALPAGRRTRANYKVVNNAE